MLIQDKYYLEIKEKLSSEKPADILAVLKKIKYSGKANIIPLIIALLDKHKNNEIGKEVINILGQLKEKEVMPYIISEIKSKHTESYRKELIMTCWQSGLDYGAHIDVFIEAFINGDYQTSIECFSVIDEWIHNCPKDLLTRSRKMLIENLTEVNEERKPFYIEMIKLVESNL